MFIKLVFVDVLLSYVDGSDRSSNHVDIMQKHKHIGLTWINRVMLHSISRLAHHLPDSNGRSHWRNGWRRKNGVFDYFVD